MPATDQPLRRRILVVDDSPIIRAAVRHALEEAGYGCATCGTFAELDHHDLDGFDLVLMDVQMPELYGDDVAVALRQREVTAPIFLFSTIDEAELADRTKEAGLDGYISKRRGLDHMMSELKKFFARG